MSLCGRNLCPVQHRLLQHACMCSSSVSPLVSVGIQGIELGGMSTTQTPLLPGVLKADTAIKEKYLAAMRESSTASSACVSSSFSFPSRVGHGVELDSLSAIETPFVTARFLKADTMTEEYLARCASRGFFGTASPNPLSARFCEVSKKIATSFSGFH